MRSKYINNIGRVKQRFKKKKKIFSSSILIYILVEMSDKVKYELEFPIQASPNMLYQYISSASNLSEWFADNVNSRGKVFSFFWDGVEEKAELLSSKNNTYVKFKWLENDDDCFFEIKITVDEITKDVSLIIIDFADNDEVEEAKMLWESQISDLKSVIGSS
jgi:uncharacterized protein YndB with AHSA1/START domain